MGTLYDKVGMSSLEDRSLQFLESIIHFNDEKIKTVVSRTGVKMELLGSITTVRSTGN